MSEGQKVQNLVLTLDPRSGRLGSKGSHPLIGGDLFEPDPDHAAATVSTSLNWCGKKTLGRQPRNTGTVDSQSYAPPQLLDGLRLRRACA